MEMTLGKNQRLWNEIIEAEQQREQAYITFYEECTERFAFVKAGLARTDINRDIALRIAFTLSVQERQSLVEDLLDIGMYPKHAETCRRIILTLPKEWLIENIEQIAEKFLVEDTYDHHLRLLEVYALIDRSLVERLALRALAHEDAEVREAGEDFLADNKPGSPPC